MRQDSGWGQMVVVVVMINSWILDVFGDFPGDSVIKNLPVIQEMQVWSLILEDLLEKKMASHSTILAWEIPWTEDPGGLQSMWSQRVRHDLATKRQQMYYESEGQRRDILKDFMLGEQEGRVMHVSKIEG